MPLFRSPSFLALAALLLGGALVGLPRVSAWSEQTTLHDGQLESLELEVSRLNHQQENLQDGIRGYHDLLEEQNLLIHNQAERLQDQELQLADGFLRLDGLRQSFDAQAVLAAAVEAPLSPGMQRAKLRHDIMRPVFQISGEDAVGSAVLVYHDSDEQGPYYLALSCYHVLRDIVATQENLDPHAVWFDTIFDQMGNEPVTVAGIMLAENIESDLALLRINTDLNLGPIAHLAPQERQSLIEAFTPVYTVGCPLGTNAQATYGQVTRNDWKVDGQDYWMVSSPAYFGNSGGGVFLEETHELVAIFSKIYTHGSYRPQVVTHMGLAVPLNTIRDWLSEVGYGYILAQQLAPVLEVQAEEASSSVQEQ